MPAGPPLIPQPPPSPQNPSHPIEDPTKMNTEHNGGLPCPVPFGGGGGGRSGGPSCPISVPEGSLRVPPPHLVVVQVVGETPNEEFVSGVRHHRGDNAWRETIRVIMGGGHPQIGYGGE